MSASDSLEGDATTRREPPPPEARAQRLGPGTEVAGRYWVLELAGAGGMGNVYRAYDATLQREVALKQLRVGGTANEARLAREARAMAQLNHPNIVAVYDAAFDGSRLTLAIEYVRGETLAAWLRHERSWGEIVDAFLAAGRGLVAAHRAGIIHRDFKPGNVIVAEDGRIKVTDFGLAKPLRSASGDLPSDGSSSPNASEADVPDDLTVAGDVLGTPSYMAPEQHDGQSADDKSDQYAFCVALWGALTETKLYSGALDEIAVKKRRGPPTWEGPAVPRRVITALEQGLRVEPSRRWPSMEALLQALERTRRRRLRPVALATTATLAVGAGAAYSLRSPPPCTEVGQDLDDTWNDERSQRITEAITSRGVGGVERTAELVNHRLEDYASAWVAAAMDNCEATHVRHTQSATQMDRRGACLERARVRFDAAIEISEQPGAAGALDDLVFMVNALPRVNQCGMMETSVTPPEAHLAAEVEHLRGQLARAEAMEIAGSAQASLSLLESVTAASEATEYDPLIAELEHLRGRAVRRLGDRTAALAAFRRSYVLAMGATDDETAARSAMVLGEVLGDLGRGEEGLLALDTARALLRRPAVDPRWIPEEGRSRGLVLQQLGRSQEAIAELRKAQEIAEATLGPDDLSVAAITRALGVVLYDNGLNDEALDIHLGLIDVLESTVGEAHPGTAGAHLNAAVALEALGRLDEAVEHLRTAKLTLERAYPGPHQNHALCDLNLAVIKTSQAKPAEALELADKALAGFAATIGDKPHHWWINAHSARGRALYALGRIDEAEQAFSEAVKAGEAVTTPDNIRVLHNRAEVARMATLAGRLDEAEQMARAVVAATAEVLPPDSVEILFAQELLAEVLLRQDRPEEALALMRRNEAIARKAQLRAASIPITQFRLGRAEYAAGQRDQGRATVTAAREALATLANVSPADRALVQEMDVWLAEHG